MMSSILRAAWLYAEHSAYTRERRLRVEFANVENRVAIDFSMAAMRALFLESQSHRGELGLTATCCDCGMPSRLAIFDLLASRPARIRSTSSAVKVRVPDSIMEYS